MRLLDVYGYILILASASSRSDISIDAALGAPRHISPSAGAFGNRSQHMAHIPSTASKVRIAAYNVLAQNLAKSSYFAYCKGDTLKLKARFPRLCKQIEALDADVLCLSEVDNVVLYYEFLTSKRYGCIFQRRKGRQYGNLIAWRKDKYEYVGGAACDMNDLALAIDAHGSASSTATPAWATAFPPYAAAVSACEAPPVGAEVAPATPLDAVDARADFARNCVGVMAALRSVSASGSSTCGIVVGCTHLFFAPHAHHIRTAQSAMFQLCLREFYQDLRLKQAWPIFAAGDFNTMPHTEPYALWRSTTWTDLTSSAALPGVALVPDFPGDITPDGAVNALIGWNCLNEDPDIAVSASVSAAPSTPTLTPSATKTTSDGSSGVSIAELASERDAGTPNVSTLPQSKQDWVARLLAWVASRREGLDQLSAVDVRASPATAVSLKPGEGLCSAYATANELGLPGAGVTYGSTPTHVLIPAPIVPHLANYHQEPAFTTLTDGFCAPIDYIFFTPTMSCTALVERCDESTSSGGGPVSSVVSTASTCVMGVYPMPLEESIRTATVAMPSPFHPSDHCALAADFTIEYK